MKVAETSGVRIEVSEYRVRPIVVTAGHDTDATAEGGRARPLAGLPRRKGGKPDPAADDAALLDAIDALTATGEYRTVGVARFGGANQPAAGKLAACRLAGMSEARGEVAARRLMAAGIVVAVEVSRVAQRGGRGRAAGLRRVGG